MKKRILSMLLLVVMLVTALPLTVLTALAAEEEVTPVFTEEAYNALYAAQDAALVSLDFFKTNEYWNETVEMPLPCEDVDGYVYNGKTYNFKSNPSDRFHTADEKWAVLRSDGNYVYYTKTGGIECAKGVNPAKVLSSSIEGQFVAPREMFATKAEAEAAMALAKAKWTKYSFEIVEIPRYIVYRETLSNGTLYPYGKDANGKDTWNTANGTIGFKTEALADAKALALAGEGATASVDGGYISADGKYYYYAAVRPMQSNEYRELQNEYINAVNAIFSSFHIGETANTVYSNLQLATIGEIGYQTKIADHYYTHYVYENGSLTLNPHNGSVYSTINKIPQTGDIYADMLMAGGDASNAGSNLFAIRGVKFQFSITGSGTKLLKLVDHSAGIPETAATEKLIAGRNTAFRFELSSTVTDLGKDSAGKQQYTVTMNTFIDGTEVVDNTPLKFDSAGDGLLAHSQSSRARFYTYRIYNRNLTAAEKAQNHFADLMKWFKMDLTPLQYVDEADMPVIHAALAGYTIDSDRDAVYTALLTAATEVVLMDYTDISPVYMALAVKYGLDISFLEKLPKSYLPTTYAYLDSVNASTVNIKAGYDAAVAADIARISAGATLSYTDYNDLYVQEDLKTAIDYFATNSIWGQEKKSSTRDETYIWKWSYLDANGKRTGISLPTDLPISGGALHLSANTNLGETNIANNYSYNGMTTEYVFADDRAGSGTFFNIDDLRISAATNGTRINFNVIGQRTTSEEGKLRIPEVVTYSYNKIEYTTYKEFRATEGFDFDPAVRTFVVQAKNPTHSIRYYAYSYANVKEAYAAEGKTFFVPKTIPSTTYYYITHDANGNELASYEQKQFAFYKPIYTEIGNNVYITGSTCRIDNKGVGLGEDGLDFFHDEYGSFSMRLDGDLLFSADNLIWPDNAGITGGTYLLYSCSGLDKQSIKRDVYAYRSYARNLSDAELVQNHFVDIAKFYKLNITGLEKLDDAAKATVYASVADLRIGETTREVAQLAVTSVLHNENLKRYEPLKGENVDVNAFIDFAAEYYIDMDLLTAILTSDRDMSALYATALVGSRAEMQALVEEAYHDAYYFLSYQLKGEDKWNAWLNSVAAADAVADIEDLMRLPWTARLGITAVDAADADAIEAYITDTLAKYEDLSTYDYNQLYIRDALIFAFDVMKTNSYWKEAIGALPTLPNELTAYEYDMNADGKIDPETEVFDFSNPAERFDTGKYVIKKTRIARSNGAKADYLYLETVKLPSGTSRQNTIKRFDTAEEAQAYINEQTKAGGKLVTEDKSYTYEYTVLNPYLVTYASFNSASVTGHSGYQIYTDRSYTDIATAEAAHVDTKARDYQVVPNAYNYAYYAAVDNYFNEMNKWLQSYIWSSAELSSELKFSTANPLSNGNGFSQIRDFEQAHACFETPVDGRGYLTQIFSHATDNGLTFNQPTDAKYKGDNVTAQLVTRTGNSITSKEAPILFYNARAIVEVEDGAFTFTGFNGSSAFKLATGSVTGSKPISTSDVVSLTYEMNGALTKNESDALDTFTVRNLTETVYEATGLYASGAANSMNTTNQVGYSNAMGGAEIYAVRYYTRSLSNAEVLQNHFADLAKWYRLDVTDYLAASPEMKAAVHTALAAFELGEDERSAVVSAMNKVLYDADYTAAESVLSAEMIAIAKKLGLNVSALMAAKEEVRAYAEALVLADFKADQPMERSVIQSLIDQALVYKAGFNFEGVQVRLQSDVYGDMPGVRAIFSVNRTAIEAYAALGKAITFGVEICNASGATLSTLYFTVNRAVDAEGNVTYTYTGKNGEADAIIREVGDNSLAFAYTVIFDEKAVQTAPYYEFEFGYRFFMEVDGLRNNADAIYSPTFEGTISAAEAYRYFYANGYANDRVVQSVIRELDGGNDVILVKTAEEAQEALDNATADTTIQLAPGVDYGTLTFRQTASSTVVDITDAGGDAPGNEKYRRIENLTILGAEGAIVDGFDFLVSWIDGSGASYIDIKNLTVEGVTFSGEATPFQLTKGSLGIDGLTLVDCRMEDADGNNRLVFQQINGYKELTDKSTGEYVMTTGVKDLTITGCEVVGAYMVIESRAMENLTITDNTFYGIKARDMLITSDTTHYPQMTYSGTITITGNTSECGEERFVRASLNNSDVTVLIKDNTIINYLGADADYIKVTEIDAANVTIENNILVP